MDPCRVHCDHQQCGGAYTTGVVGQGRARILASPRQQLGEELGREMWQSSHHQDDNEEAGPSNDRGKDPPMNIMVSTGYVLNWYMSVAITKKKNASYMACFGLDPR